MLSWAGGKNTIASGNYSFAFGLSSKATTDYSFVVGRNSHASGYISAAFGNLTRAVGDYAFVNGYKSYAGGSFSTASGVETVAKGYGTFVIGMYNDSLLTTDNTGPGVATNAPLFIVGNGGANFLRSNAMVVRKNGLTELKTVKANSGKITTLGSKNATIGTLNSTSGTFQNISLTNMAAGTFSSNSFNTSSSTINGGTPISKLQSGTYQVGPNSTHFKVVTINFSTPFTNSPLFQATAKNQAGTNYNDSFIVKVRSISASAVTLNIVRVDVAAAWGQYLQLDWMTWEK